MIQIRRGIFETNSSSSHTLVIDKGAIANVSRKIYFKVGDYGWEFNIVEDTQNYLWSLILCSSHMLNPNIIDPENTLNHKEVLHSDMDIIELVIRRMTNIFSSYGIKVEFEVPVSFNAWEGCVRSINSDLENLDIRINTETDASVDHGTDAIGFIADLFKQPELMVQFCCNEGSEVITGNDNSDMQDVEDVYNEYTRVVEDNSGKYLIYNK